MSDYVYAVRDKETKGIIDCKCKGGKYYTRKKPVVIEAMQFVVTEEIPCKFGIHRETNSMEIAEFMNQPIHVRTVPNGTKEGRVYIEIPTLEGIHQADIGDYIIKGVKGEFYPCKPDIFKQTYEIEEQ